MEGATVAEATAVAGRMTASCGIGSMNPEPGVPNLALADETGTIVAAGIQAALSSDHPYARPVRPSGYRCRPPLGLIPTGPCSQLPRCPSIQTRARQGFGLSDGKIRE
jgi:hypothetical protein